MDVICRKCGSVNDYNVTQKGRQKTAFCNGCGTYIKNIPYEKPKLYFGKYKGALISEMNSGDQLNYLRWMLKSGLNLSPHIKNAINQKLESHD